MVSHLPNMKLEEIAEQERLPFTEEYEQLRLPFPEETNNYVDDIDYSLEELESIESYRFFVNKYHLKVRP